MRNALRIGFNFFKSFIWRQTPRIVLSVQPRQNPSKIVVMERGKSLDSKKSTQRKSLRPKPPLIKQTDSNKDTVEELDKCSVYAINESRSRDKRLEKTNGEKISNNNLNIPKQEVFINQFVFYEKPQINSEEAKIQIQNQNKNKQVVNIQKQEEMLLSATNIISQKKQHRNLSIIKPIISELNAMNPNLFLSINNQQQQTLRRHNNLQSQNPYISNFSFSKKKQHQENEFLHEIPLIYINKKKQIGKRLLKSKHSSKLLNLQRPSKQENNKFYKKKVPNECGICKRQITSEYQRLACTHKIHKSCKTQYMQYQMKYRCKLCQIKPRTRS